MPRRLSQSATALLVSLVGTVLIVLLLTPLGFESRPQSALKLGGFVAIATIFLGLALFLGAIGILFRRPGLSSKLATVASLLFFLPLVGDQAGIFFALPIPPAIQILEGLLLIALLANLFLASRVHRETKASG